MAGRPVPLTAGPWVGMRYARWSGKPTPDRVYAAYNAYVDSDGLAGAYRSRPGRVRAATSAIGSAGNGQLAYQFTKNTGTQYTVAICGGKFYTFNWATSTWTEVLTASDFSSASITLSSTARCHAVTFNNTLVVSDGTNVPWTWDGTTNGGLTKLTNCPVLYGQPTVYAGKLFGIKNTDPASIVWSEENAANTGYEAGGYSNVWALIQQGSDPIYAIRATNDGLYYWRQRSIGVIRGAFGADFETSNTFDAVSNNVGTRSPRGVLYHNDTFYFPDEYGRPWALRQGAAAIPIWEQVALAFPQDTSDDDAVESIRHDVAVTATDLLAMETVPVSSLRGVLFTSSKAALSGDDTHGGLYFGGDGTAQSMWEWDSGNSAGVGACGWVINSQTNLPEVLFVEDDGRTYVLGRRDLWYDEQSDGTDVSAAATWVGPRLGASAFMELQFAQLDVVVDARVAGAVTVGALLLTSRDARVITPLSVAVTTARTVTDKRVPFGFNRNGRWVQAYITMTAGANFPVTLHGYTVTAYGISTSPLVP